MSDDEAASDEEDWFERALRDLEGSTAETDRDGTEGDDGSGGNDGPGGDDAATGEAVGTEDLEATDPDAAVEADADGGDHGADTVDHRGADGGDDHGAEEPSMTDPFGGVVDGTDPFGGPMSGSADGDETTFDDREFEALGGGSAFDDRSPGFGAGGDAFPSADPGPDFDEETFESDIDRVDVGIEGLDEMILGGIPERSLLVAIGAAGTGKTTFGLQFLTETLRDDGSAVYITLEESREAILETAEEKGWPFREWVDEDRLAVVSMDPVEMANSLSSIRSDISRLVDEFGADRLVLDSVSLLEMMYDHPATRRSEVFDFARSLKRAGVTTMLTSEANEENPYASRYGIVEYLVDAVFILQYVRPSNFRETRLAVEIQKIRDANHSRETKPYEITSDGISVYRQANIF